MLLGMLENTVRPNTVKTFTHPPLAIPAVLRVRRGVNEVTAIAMAVAWFRGCILLVLSAALKTKDTRGDCKIFAMWDYHPNKVPFFIQKDLESWDKHSHGRCGSPVLINNTNIKDYIPDLPAEYFRLPDHGARSDVIRYALIYHHGGIYMDTDILILKDLNEVLDKVTVGDYDLISYARNKNCKAFSSNFLAGRKKSHFMKAVWEAQKEALRSHCEDVSPDNHVCCPNDPKKRRCRRDGFPPRLRSPGSGDEELLLRRGGWRILRT